MRAAALARQRGALAWPAAPAERKAKHEYGAQHHRYDNETTHVLISSQWPLSAAAGPAT